MKYTFTFLLLSLIIACQTPDNKLPIISPKGYGIAILGIAQDAGYPQAGCFKDCCQPYLEGKESARHATSIAIINFETSEKWLFEATPDIKHQLYQLQKITEKGSVLPNGVFLTHAHIGHYTGLMHFGHEVMGTDSLPVFAMTRMATFLSENGPWSQLVKFGNINLKTLQADSAIQLNAELRVIPFIVPHRDEYSETVGYKIVIKEKTILFIPDINKWNSWDRDIIEEIKSADLALLDATFYKNGELPNRDMSQIPHPFVEESMALFHKMSKEEKQKVMFIHFNHTNPLLRNTPESETVIKAGYQLAREGMVLEMNE